MKLISMVALAALNILEYFPFSLAILFYPFLIGLSWLAWLVGRVELSHRSSGLTLRKV